MANWMPLSRIHWRNASVESPNNTFSRSSQTDPHGGADHTGEFIAARLAEPGADTFMDAVLRLDVTTLIVDDPDAPDPAAPQRVWVHWVLYNLPVECTGLPEDVRELPAGTLDGLNDWKLTGYGGPCPPIGRHRYFHKLYALDTVLSDLGCPDKKTLLQAMQGHILAEAQCIGTYQKGD